MKRSAAMVGYAAGRVLSLLVVTAAALLLAGWPVLIWGLTFVTGLYAGFVGQALFGVRMRLHRGQQIGHEIDLAFDASVDAEEMGRVVALEVRRAAELERAKAGHPSQRSTSDDVR